ncbi:hypothetical protein [Limisalsivibrio acetivorans]|uniref:hypothetical protein n=1 Tax=Limisalsivibrio acetivorans TaxID=1304888 RepID=UPI0003B438BC|nr:hypothetical protein [Limisalsivibrio acetivorans]
MPTATAGVENIAVRLLKNAELILRLIVVKKIFSSDSAFHRKEMGRADIDSVVEEIVNIADNIEVKAQELESDFVEWIHAGNAKLRRGESSLMRVLEVEEPEPEPFAYYNASLSHMKSLITFCKAELLVALDDDDRSHLRNLMDVCRNIRASLSRISKYRYDVECVHTDIVEGTEESVEGLYKSLEYMFRIAVQDIATEFTQRRIRNNREFARNYTSDYIHLSGGRTVETANLLWLFRFIFWEGEKKRPSKYPVNHILSIGTTEYMDFRKEVDNVLKRVVGTQGDMFGRFNSLFAQVMQGRTLKRLDQEVVTALDDIFFDMWAIAAAKTILMEKGEENA